MEVIEKPQIDLLDIREPSLSATSDMPVIETKPDSQAKPEVKAEVKPDNKPAAEEKPKVDDKAAVVETKKPEDSATPETPEDDPAANAEPAPKAKGVQKRIDELVRQREEEKAEKLRLMAMLEQVHKPKPEPQEVVNEDPEPQKPVREAFGSTDEFVAALAEYADTKSSWSSRHAVADALAAEKRKVEQGQIEAGQKAARDAYAKRVEQAVEEFPDYKAVAESPDVLVSVPMAHAILHSDHGPKIAYHLGKNPEEAKRISLLSPPVQLMEMGLLVARLTAPAAASPVVTPAPQKPAVSAAPKPIKPLDATPETPTKSPQDETMEEYAARRHREQAAERRPGART